jgi:hypothetical protein
MGTTLTGTTPQDTYDSLIKVTDNGPISGTLKALSDGLGNDSTLSLSTTAASIAGTLAVTGNATFSSTTAVASAGATSQMRIDRTSGVARLQNYDSGSAANISLQHDGGNVGIGTSSPNAPIQINGAPLENLPARATIRTFDTSSPAANVGAGMMLGYQFDTAQFVDGACVQAVKENGTLGNYATSLAFLTRANAAGFTEKVRILSSGGITFNGDTAAANALDDYEEGTWTPAYAGSGGGSAIHDIQLGTYTKIGKVVTCTFRIAANKSTLSGNISLTGLPFSTAIVNGIALNAVRRFATDFVAFGEVSGTSLLLYKNDSSSAGGTSVTDTDLEAITSHNDLRGAFSYLV